MVVVILVAAFVATRVIGIGGSGSLISLDNSSKDAGQVAGARTPGAGQQGTNDQGTPAAEATSISSLDQASVRKDAFILLNPASATAGSTVGVSGSGFDPASAIDFYLTEDPKNDKNPQELGFAQADSGGSFGSFSFSLPPNYRAPTFTVIAKERNSDKQATATGRLESLRPSVKLGTNVGSVGDQVQISAQGFMPNEEVKVYFNSLGTDSFQTFHASNSGTIEKQAITIPYGPVGNNSLIFVGTESQSPVTVPFLMLTLYPNVALNSYASKADTVLAFSGSGFGPNEEVSVHLNNPKSPPIVKFTTDGKGTFENAGAFVIPFELTGKNTLIFVGEKSQATATAGFDVLPYTPNVQPSTYGGRPGTTIAFYGDGFARDEVVRFYVGRNQQSQGQEVACAKADDKGQIGAGGSYSIPPDAQPGKLEFTAVGTRSKAVTSATVQVMDAGVPLQAPAQPPAPFHCPYDDQESGPQSPPPTAEPAGPPPTPQRPPVGAPPVATLPAATPSQATPTADRRPAATPRATASPVATPNPTARPRATSEPVPSRATPTPVASRSPSTGGNSGGTGGAARQ